MGNPVMTTTIMIMIIKPKAEADLYLTLDTVSTGTVVADEDRPVPFIRLGNREAGSTCQQDRDRG
jgi:hypothetical protein